MATRYNSANTKTTSVLNSDSMKEILDNRGISQATHYATNNIKYPTSDQIRTLNISYHYWSSNDKYWKLAAKYYGDPKYWWVIAWYNKKPIESMINLGDPVAIPMPLDRLLGMF